MVSDVAVEARTEHVPFIVTVTVWPATTPEVSVAQPAPA
jgi:hypothetical protein